MPEKFAVVYISRYGAAKQYAQWLAQAMGADLFDGDGLHMKDLKEYPSIVFGSGVYAGRLPVASLIRKAASAFPEKKLTLFTAGLTDLSNAEYYQKLVKSNLPGIPLRAFHFPGKINAQKMKLFHRIIANLMISALRKKPSEQLTDNDRAFIKTGESGQLDRSAVTPLVAALQNT